MLNSESNLHFILYSVFFTHSPHFCSFSRSFLPWAIIHLQPFHYFMSKFLGSFGPKMLKHWQPCSENGKRAENCYFYSDFGCCCCFLARNTFGENCVLFHKRRPNKCWCWIHSLCESPHWCGSLTKLNIEKCLISNYSTRTTTTTKVATAQRNSSEIGKVVTHFSIADQRSYRFLPTQHSNRKYGGVK